MKKIVFFGSLVLTLSIGITAEGSEDQAGWMSLFDGKTLNGWKAAGHENSFNVRDGMIVAHGKPFSHLFYAGSVNGGVFQNFEFKAEVMTNPHSNGGIYFHTKYQPTGWPKAGCEVQVNNTYKDKRKTGSLYRVQDNFQAPAKDNEWFTEHIVVRGSHVTIKVDGKTIADWTAPEDWRGIRAANPDWEGDFSDCVLGSGTFALQAHDEHSVVYYRNIRVKPLP